MPTQHKINEIDEKGRYTGGIYSQGELCDRRVETILERRQTLIHSTLAGGKNAPRVIPYPIYAGEGLANPYHSYVGGASQTLTTTTTAGDEKGIKNANARGLKNAA
jgi:hypothetical protein